MMPQRNCSSTVVSKSSSTNSKSAFSWKDAVMGRSSTNTSIEPIDSTQQSTNSPVSKANINANGPRQPHRGFDERRSVDSTCIIDSLDLNWDGIILKNGKDKEGMKRDENNYRRSRSASADQVLHYNRSCINLWTSSNTSIGKVDAKNASNINTDTNIALDSQSEEVDYVYRRLNRSHSLPTSNNMANILLDRSLMKAVKKNSKQVSNASSNLVSQEEKVTDSPSNCTRSTYNGLRVVSEEYSGSESEDTQSESTSYSSCTSPRHNRLTLEPAKFSPLDMAGHDIDEQSDILSFEEEQDEEAMNLLDRINGLSAEFQAYREYEERNALLWLVQQAAGQGAISHSLQQNLHGCIRNGSLEEARDVLYHRCHLVPAARSVVENPTTQPVESPINQSFLRVVNEISPMELSEARLHKRRVLKQLSELLVKWVKFVGQERGLSEEHIALTRGSMFVAGSFRLGVNDPTSDIDAVCVGPWHVTHDDFFGSFCHLLRTTDGVSHLAPVPNAYVPLISLSLHGVNIDLLYARLPTSSIDTHLKIDSDHILMGVHPVSMKSLNAPRVSSMILCLVPQRRVFRIVLRAVRGWARRRGIYSAKLGYLGGVSWAIMVAFVCQLYPSADPAKVLLRFFQVFAEWSWPQPVMLNVVYDAGLGFEMWDPRQKVYDRAHIMPIITPAYPHMNSSVQVSLLTFTVIQEELWRARAITESIIGSVNNNVLSSSSSSMPVSSTDTSTQFESLLDSVCSSSQELNTNDLCSAGESWNTLFEPSDFFTRYSSYLVVDFEAASLDAMNAWGKFVESRLRKLVDSLQHVTSVARVHGFPRYFPHTSGGRAPGSCMFIGVKFNSEDKSKSKTKGKGANNRGGNKGSVLPQDEPDVKANFERTIKFFFATDLQQFSDRQADMVADARLITWENLPEFVFSDLEYKTSNISSDNTLSKRELAQLKREEFLKAEQTGVNSRTNGSLAKETVIRPMYYTPPYYPNSNQSRNPSGKWKGNNGARKYNGGKGKQYRQFSSNFQHNNPRSQTPITTSQGG